MRGDLLIRLFFLNESRVFLSLAARVLARPVQSVPSNPEPTERTVQALAEQQRKRASKQQPLSSACHCVLGQ